MILAAHNPAADVLTFVFPLTVFLVLVAWLFFVRKRG